VIVLRKTILILGASGLTGYKAYQIAKNRCEVVGTYNIRQSPDSSLVRLDISKEDELRKLFSDVKPDCVLNTTALHNVDYCETHADEAYAINSKAVAAMANLCNNIGARLVHISTDFVFDGEKGNYTETDKPAPLSVYAKSKLEGESQARKCSSHCIIRTSVVYGWTPLETQGSNSSSGKPMNFGLWVLSKLKNNEELKIVNDQFTSPTLADVLAAAAIRLAMLDKNDLYHVSGTTEISRYGFTKKLAEIMGYPSARILPIDSSAFKQAAKRPKNSSLCCNKVQSDMAYKLLDVDQSLAVMRSQIEVESPSLLGA
jgi:dTDP-4-dehydrorhamnose reductase